ncbi:MAG TPA: rhomboid family intramembrane serine protease [Pseudonocardia sp.]|nr:rhomboid family intramembrane serine protease [Pseudonocardia sp.]
MTHPTGPTPPHQGGPPQYPAGGQPGGSQPGPAYPGPYPSGPQPAGPYPGPAGPPPGYSGPVYGGPEFGGPGYGGPPAAPPTTVCVRHPDRATALTCTRCDRPACPECLQSASVGAQCVDCVRAANRGMRRWRTVAGAEPGHRPLVVPVLIALNVAVFLWTVSQARSITGNYNSALFDAWALAPGEVQDGEWWRVLTSGFLHIGPIHLVFNMMALWVLGRDMELVLGRARFVAVYLISLLGGAAAVMLFYAPSDSVAGASGAVFGLMGGLAVVLKRMHVPAGQVISLIAVNVVISVVIPGISLIGHLGGLVVGAAATAALVYAPARHQARVQVIALGALTVLLLVVIAAPVL